MHPTAPNLSSPTGPAGSVGHQSHKAPSARTRVALLGNPNTGKTTLFNRLCGLRHKTSNFPGTTQEARQGFLGESSGPRCGIELIDLPGIYSLELAQPEAEVCRKVLAGELAPKGEPLGPPDATIVVLDGANLSRNLLLAGEVLRRRLPTVCVVNMIDLARKCGLTIDAEILSREVGCEVVLLSARSGEGCEAVRPAIERAKIPNRTPPGTQEGLEGWTDRVYSLAVRHAPAPQHRPSRASRRFTDRLDNILTHPVLGAIAFLLIMAGLFWSIFSLAKMPMDLLSGIFDGNSGLIRAWQPQWLQTALSSGVKGLVSGLLPEGLLREFVADGVISGIGATVVFLPQICLLFFLISLLEDTGYLARAAFVMDRVLRPFGLPGHSFVPLLSSHACALPGIMACRGIPDRKERLATILVAPFMTCSARLPVYVLMTAILFPGQPGKQALAFIGCYALGIAAGVASALIARRTILRGKSRPMALELPTYKMPSLRTAVITTYDRGLTFLKKAGTNILAICVVLWWLGSFPKVAPPAEAVSLRAQAAAMVEPAPTSPPTERVAFESRVEEMNARADRLTASDARRRSLIGHLGYAFEPLFRPIGCDWQLTIGVLTSFAAREVFVSTMAVLISGTEDAENDHILDEIKNATRTDGSPLFPPATAWALLVYFVLAMQCLPTLAVTARESGHIKWALLQFAWMSGLAYGVAMAVHALVGALT